MTHVRRTLLIAAGAATLLLSACGSETPGTAAPGPAASQQSIESEPTTTTSSSSSAASAPSAAGLTEPGTSLKFGEKAVVPFSYGTTKTGTIAVTVTGIEQGENSELVKFGEKAKGITPYYVRLTVENVSGNDLAGIAVELRGLGDDGRSTGVALIGDTDKCDSTTAKRDFTTAGAKYETCTLAGAKDGSKVTTVAFNRGDGYQKSPILWKS